VSRGKVLAISRKQSASLSRIVACIALLDSGSCERRADAFALVNNELCDDDDDDDDDDEDDGDGTERTWRKRSEAAESADCRPKSRRTCRDEIREFREAGRERVIEYSYFLCALLCGRVDHTSGRNDTTWRAKVVRVPILFEEPFR